MLLLPSRAGRSPAVVRLGIIEGLGRGVVADLAGWKGSSFARPSRPGVRAHGE